MTTQPQPSTTHVEPTGSTASEPATPALSPYPPVSGTYRTTAAGPYGPDTGWQALPAGLDTRMRRSATDKMLAGVCGGIAEHTDIDPVYIRLAFLVSSFWGGIGVIAYIAAAIIMPKPLS